MDRAREILAKVGRSREDQRRDLIEEFLALGSEPTEFLAQSFTDLSGPTLEFGSAVLSRAKGPTVVEPLVKALGHASPLIRRGAIDTLGAIGDPRGMGALIRMSGDPDADVRAAVVRHLATMSSSRAADAVENLCADPDVDVRGRAITALFKVLEKQDRARELVPALLRVLDRLRGRDRAEVASALGRAGSAEALPALLRLLRDEFPEVRAAAAIAVGSLGNPKAADPLVAQMKVEREKWPRVRMADASPKVKARPAIEPLIAWLGESDQDVRAAAFQALRTMTGQALEPDPAKWSAWWQNNKRASR
jgi:HEAT repeat protein